MSESPTDRRLVENEVVFRDFNENLQKSFDEINRIAAEEGEQPVSLNADQPLHFMCECSDEQCHLRIKLSPKEYDKIHETDDQFIIIPGHQVENIEDVIKQSPDYYVVKKYNVPPRSEVAALKTKRR